MIFLKELSYQSIHSADEVVSLGDEFNAKVIKISKKDGKTRFEIELAADADNAAIEQLVRSDERTAKYVEDKQIVKVIIVPKRMVNIVIK